MSDLPKWLMGDPSVAAEHLERAREQLSQQQSEIVEDLLTVWYEWARSHREFLGHSRVSPMFRGADSSEVHDDGEARDHRLHSITAEMVDSCVSQLSVVQRSSIDLHFWNKTTPVFRKKRLGDPTQAHTIYKEAKYRLWPLLRKKGLTDG